MAAKQEKRNPQDATLRNVNALKKRVATLEEKVASLERAVDNLQSPSPAQDDETVPVDGHAVQD